MASSFRYCSGEVKGALTGVAALLGLGTLVGPSNKYVITDMFAKAVQGMKPEEAVKWAESELKKVYEA